MGEVEVSELFLDSVIDGIYEKAVEMMGRRE
jgi:hypothetical protein